MFYINNKKVKEWIVRGVGDDTFLHRVSRGIINNQDFYGGNSSDSQFVDIKVYHEGKRVKTTPQLVPKTELSSTTITVQLNVDYALKVSNASRVGVIDFSGTANQQPTFKLDSSTTASTVYIYLTESSYWRNTNLYSMILSDTNYSSIAKSSIGKDCGFDNAQVYVRNSSSYYNCVLGGLAILGTANHPDDAYLMYNLIDPPDLSDVFSGSSSLIRFGYLPQSTAEAMGFSPENNPNGYSKESTDYWGWGCWIEDEQWLWSDAELAEIFSTDGNMITATNDWKSIIKLAGLSYGDTLHWGIYDLDSSIIESFGGCVQLPDAIFTDGWIFDHDDSSMLSDVYSLKGMSLSSVLNNYLPSPQGTVTLIVPFSQVSTGGDSMSDLYTQLVNTSLLTSDFSTYVDQFFNSSPAFEFAELIHGEYSTNVADSGYMYCCNPFGNGSIDVATSSNSLTLNVGQGNSVIYIGARSKDLTLSVTFDESVPSSVNYLWSSEYLSAYKLLPFIASNSSGGISSDGSINLQ